MGHIGIAEYALMALALLYCLSLGPMVFETFTSDRTWASAPPNSFHMFYGPHGHKTAHYWKVVTPLAGVTLLLSLVLNWPAVDRRAWLLAFFTAYLAVQIPTLAYFVPEQERLVVDGAKLGREALKARADRWVLLAYLRNVAGVVGFVFLMLALLTHTTA